MGKIMKQEYLLQDNNEKEAIESYKVKGITTTVLSAGDDKCLYARFSTPLENEKAARQLSDIHEHIYSNFNVIVLESGCSEYFNRRLYPLASEFECKLRKLLYLKSALDNDEKASSNIVDLELKDLGQIFSLLFIDTGFMSKVKESIKSQNKDCFTKEYIIKIIQETEENALWDTLLGKETVPTLRKEFNDVRSFRNDIMHSHIVTWKRYKEIATLFKTINEELSNAIREIVGTESSALDSSNYNEILDSALKTYDQFIILNYKNEFQSLKDSAYDLYMDRIKEKLRSEIASHDMLDSSKEEIKAIYRVLLSLFLNEGQKKE